MTQTPAPTTEATISESEAGAIVAKEQILARLETYAKSRNPLGYYGPGDSWIDQNAVAAIVSLLSLITQQAAENAGLREAISSGGRLRQTISELLDAAQTKIDECAPYLKEDETPRERMDRDFADNQDLLSMLAAATARAEASESREAAKDAEIAGLKAQLGGGIREIAGWKLVPVEPTEAMVDAWPRFNKGAGHERAIYAAMISAAPTPPDCLADANSKDTASESREAALLEKVRVMGEAVEAEREACLKIAEQTADCGDPEDRWDNGYRTAGRSIADRIKDRAALADRLAAARAHNPPQGEE